VVFFDIPVARQVFGLLFLTFVPGVIIVNILGLKDQSRLERLLISIGLSIAFLMIGGLLLNEFSLFAGFSTPLQSVPLMAVLSVFTIFGGVLIYIRKDSIRIADFAISKQGLSTLFPFGLILLSVVGAYFVNAYNNNIILLVTILSISALFLFLATFKKIAHRNLYAIAVFAIALSLLYHASLISQYIVPYGSDVPLEYSVFNLTNSNHHWSAINPYGNLIYGRFNSMLSITILPTFYANILDLDPTILFKTLYPLIFAFVPLCLYQLWQKYIGAKYALIAAFLFMAQQTFYTEMLGLNRQIVAELFFALLLLVILNKTLKPAGKAALFIVFSFGLVVSHYGLSEIFIFFAVAAFAYAFITKRTNSRVTVFSIVSFPVIMFFWYIYTSGSAVFDSILEFSNYVFSQFGEFLNPASRGQTVMLGLGLETAPTIWNTISRVFAYSVEILIVLGFVVLITKRVKSNFDKDYIIFTFIATAFLGALIIVPGLANTLNMTRFFHILLFFLAPLCVIGGYFLARLVSKRRKLVGSVLLVAVLVPYFLFQVGFIYEVTGSDSWSVPLSGYRMQTSRLYGQFGYIDEYSTAGAQWLSKNVNTSGPTLYSSGPSRFNVLTCYGLVYRGYINEVNNVTKMSNGSTLYLSTFETQEGAINSGAYSWNLTNLSFNLTDLSKVYTNGQSEIYQYMP
jgi:uncharacterized membrane protein